MAKARLAKVILGATWGAWAVCAAAAVVADDAISKETEVVAEETKGACGAPGPESAAVRNPGKVLKITWERLLADAETCPRCGSTEVELDKAAALLRTSLEPLGVTVAVEKREITPAEFQADPSRSNRVWFNGRLLEEWLGAQTGQSPCCDVCGDAECRTVEVAGEEYETIPADIIVRAGLAAAAALPDAPPSAPCCGDR